MGASLTLIRIEKVQLITRSVQNQIENLTFITTPITSATTIISLLSWSFRKIDPSHPETAGMEHSTFVTPAWQCDQELQHH